MPQLPQYLREVIQELRKVSWPTRKQTFNLTLLVIGVTLLTALYIGGLDLLFQRLMALIVEK
jgi:preprotein translocase subunit SecE